MLVLVIVVIIGISATRRPGRCAKHLCWRIPAGGKYPWGSWEDQHPWTICSWGTGTSWSFEDFRTVWWRINVRWMSDLQRSVEPVWRKLIPYAGCLLSLRLTSQYQVSSCKFLKSRIIESFQNLICVYVPEREGEAGATVTEDRRQREQMLALSQVIAILSTNKHEFPQSLKGN